MDAGTYIVTLHAEREYVEGQTIPPACSGPDHQTRDVQCLHSRLPSGLRVQPTDMEHGGVS